MLSSIEVWLLGEILSVASSPDVKAYALKALKQADAAATNPLLKVVIEAVEGFLAAPAPAQ